MRLRRRTGSRGMQEEKEKCGGKRAEAREIAEWSGARIRVLQEVPSLLAFTLRWDSYRELNWQISLYLRMVLSSFILKLPLSPLLSSLL